MGQAAITCRGIILQPQEAEAAGSEHAYSIERIEDEYHIQIQHSMTKNHYISFIAAASADRIQMVKLYPEGSA